MNLINDTINYDQRNQIVLADFIKYCMSHPQERFWQALRNWSKYSFVLVGDLGYDELEHIRETHRLKDTFYWEGKDK